MAALFEAQWISGPAYEYGADEAGYYADHPNHVLSKSFDLPKVEGRQATLTIAVLGYAKVLVNGRPLPKVELLGDWTNFTRQVTYRSFDVSELVREGANTFRIELGNGWYNPSPLRLFGKYNLRERLAEVGTPAVLATLELDGSTLVRTDDSWTCTEGQLLFNNIYLGERRDLSATASKELPLRAWGNERVLEPARVEPSCRFEAVPGTDVRELADGSLLVDFHVLETGMIDFAFCAHADDVVSVCYAEELDEQGVPSYESSYAGLVGMVVPEGFRISGGPGAPEYAIQRDSVIAGEGENRFVNTFTLHSARYAQIKGIDVAQLRHIELIPVHTDLAAAGSLATGNDFYEQLVDAALRTKLNNNHGLWEDCARERLGYGGDMIALALSNLMAFDCEALIRKTVRDFRNDQTPAGGVPETAPFMGIGSNGTAYGEGPMLWQLAYPHLVLRAYQYYGARDLVEEEWPYVRKLIDYLLSWEPEELAPHCLGDHGSPVSTDFKGGTPDKELVGWCTIARFARAGVRFCEILGEDGSVYEAKFSELTGEICRRFRHEDGSWGAGTQTGLAFVADLGLADEHELAERLVAKMAEQDGVLNTGIFGATIAYDLLHRMGHDDAIEAWLTREGAPSYRAMLASGNRALAETFETFLSSYNHAMFSSYLQWMYQGLAGIRVADDAVGADHIVLQPYFSPLSNEVACDYETPRGTVKLRWQRDAQGALSFAYGVPEGVRVDVLLPDGVDVRRLA